MKRIFFAMLVLMLFSCALDLGEEASKDLASTIPDTVIYNFSRTVYEKGKKRFEFSAKKGENFEKLQAIRLTDITFAEYSVETGAVTAKGNADFGIFYTNTESAELSGNVRYNNSKEEFEVVSGYLYWDGQERVLKSRLDIVTSLRDKNSTLAGAGFHADAKTRSFWFDDYVSGKFEQAEQADQAPQAQPSTQTGQP